MKDWHELCLQRRENVVSTAWKEVKELITTSALKIFKKHRIMVHTFHLTIDFNTITDETRHWDWSNHEQDECTVCKQKRDGQKDKLALDAKRVLFVATRNSISTRSLQDLLSNANGDLRYCLIRSLRKSVDDEICCFLPIFPVADGVDAAYFNIQNLLNLVLPKLSLPHTPDRIIRLSFSGDGRVSRRMHSILFTLKVVTANHQSTQNCFPVAVARGNEKYENVKIVLNKLYSDLKALKTLSVVVHEGEEPWTLSLSLCCDGKFLLTIMGLIGASGDQSCPFCLVPKSMWEQIPFGLIDCSQYLRHSMKKLNQMRNESIPCLKHTSSLQYCKGANHGIKEKNLIEDLFELEDIVIDELHLFIRLFDSILHQLLCYIEAFDLENNLEAIAAEIGVVFHVLDSITTKEGYQSWTLLTGGKSEILLEGLIHGGDNNLLQQLFYVGQ